MIPCQSSYTLKGTAACQRPAPECRKKVGGKEQQRETTTTSYDASCFTEGTEYKLHQ